MAYIRVQILLDQEENAALDQEARRLRVSRSEVVRRSLRPLVERAAEDPFLAMVGSVTDSEGVSDRHDTALYGAEMRP